jgi:hypothetical protein
MHLEHLESRIALATLTGNTLTWVDVDQDLVTLVLKTKAEAEASHFIFDTAFDSTGPQILRTIALAGQSDFNGASITISVEKTDTGDSKVSIGFIGADGIDLKSVTVPGDLGGIKAGSGTTKLAIKSLTVGSLGVNAQQTLGTTNPVTSDLLAGAGKITVTGDVGKAVLNVTSPTANIDDISVGGDVRGELNFGKVGKLIIVGALDGLAEGIGSVNASTIGVTSIGGITGGEGFTDGILRVQKATKLTIKGDVLGGTLPGTGNIQIGTVKSLTVEGDVAATVFNSGEIGINQFAKSIVITGSLNGGNLSAPSVNKINVGGNLDGSIGEGGGSILVFDKLGQVTVGGDVKGGNLAATGVIDVSGKLGKVVIEGNLVGGTADGTGSVFATDSIGDVTINGGIIGGDFEDTGTVSSLNGSIGRVRIAESVTDDSHVNSGRIQSRKGIASVTILGSFSGSILTEGKLGPVRVDGSISGTANDRAVIGAQMAIASLSVKANASFLDVDSGSFLSALGNPDVTIGNVKIGGTATAMNIFVGISPNEDGVFGTSDDVLADPNGGGKGRASIRSLTIGQVAATEATDDSFAIVAEQIGKIIVGRNTISLNKGVSNDPYSVAVSGDLIAFEVSAT